MLAAFHQIELSRDLMQLYDETVEIEKTRKEEIDFLRGLGLSSLSRDAKIYEFLKNKIVEKANLKSCELYAVVADLVQAYGMQLKGETSCKAHIEKALTVLEGTFGDNVVKEIEKTFKLGSEKVVYFLKAWAYQLMSFYYQLERDNKKEYEFFMRGLQLRLDHGLYERKIELASKLLERIQMCHFWNDLKKPFEKDVYLQKQRAYLIEASYAILHEARNKDRLSYVYHWMLIAQACRVLEASADEWRANGRPGVALPPIAIDYSNQDFTDPDWCYTLENLPLTEGHVRLEKLLKTKEDVSKVYDTCKKSRRLMIRLPSVNLATNPMDFANKVIELTPKHHFPFLK